MPTSSSTVAVEPAWRSVTDQYELAIDGDAVVCRNAKGRRLKSVPKAARTAPAAEELYAVLDYLKRHEAECRSTIETWMLGAFPIPVDLVRALWPDPTWRSLLTDLAVTGDLDAEPGLLRQIDDDGRVGVVNLDAETEWFGADRFYIPHPVLLPDLADIREFAAELGVNQAVPQLAREVHVKPADVAGIRIDDYTGGEFPELRQARRLAGKHRFVVRGGYVICHAVDDGVQVQARYWIGDDGPDYETETGALLWVDENELPIRLADVGPVAWSEGVRMAELVYAGRKTQQ